MTTPHPALEHSGIVSSTGPKQTLLRIGAHVDAVDGPCGHLTRLVVDPVTQSVTDIVVTPRHHGERSRLVPVDVVETVENDAIRLRCTKHEFDQFDSAEDAQFLTSADVDPGGYEIRSERWPLFLLELDHGPGANKYQPQYSDRVPLGEVEICRGDPVHATDGWIGEVDGLVIDRGDHKATHVLVREGRLRDRKQVTIPIGSAARIGEHIEVDLTKDQIADLPAVRLTSSRPAPRPGRP